MGLTRAFILLFVASATMHSWVPRPDSGGGFMPIVARPDPPVVEAGGGFTMHVQLNGRPTYDQPVDVTTDTPSAFSHLPEVVTVPAGTDSVEFKAVLIGKPPKGLVSVTVSCNGGSETGWVTVAANPG